MVAPGYFARATAFTLAAVVPVSGVSPACPLLEDSLEVVVPVVPLAAVADPPIAKAAPPPNPASTRAAAATVFLVLFIMRVSLVLMGVRPGGPTTEACRPIP